MTMKKQKSNGMISTEQHIKIQIDKGQIEVDHFVYLGYNIKRGKTARSRIY